MYMCIYMYTNTHMYTCIFVHLCIYIHTCVHRLNKGVKGVLAMWPGCHVCICLPVRIGERRPANAAHAASRVQSVPSPHRLRTTNIGCEFYAGQARGRP